MGKRNTFMSLLQVPFVFLLPPSSVLPVPIRAAHGGACTFEGHFLAPELTKGELVLFIVITIF